VRLLPANPTDQQVLAVVEAWTSLLAEGEIDAALNMVEHEPTWTPDAVMALLAGYGSAPARDRPLPRVTSPQSAVITHVKPSQTVTWYPPHPTPAGRARGVCNLRSPPQRHLERSHCSFLAKARSSRLCAATRGYPRSIAATLLFRWRRHFGAASASSGRRSLTCRCSGLATLAAELQVVRQRKVVAEKRIRFTTTPGLIAHNRCVEVPAATSSALGGGTRIPVSASVLGSSFESTLTARGRGLHRLFIPASVCRAHGFEPGDDVPVTLARASRPTPDPLLPELSAGTNLCLAGCPLAATMLDGRGMRPRFSSITRAVTASRSWSDPHPSGTSTGTSSAPWRSSRTGPTRARP